MLISCALRKILKQEDPVNEKVLTLLKEAGFSHVNWPLSQKHCIPAE